MLQDQEENDAVTYSSAISACEKGDTHFDSVSADGSDAVGIGPLEFDAMHTGDAADQFLRKKVASQPEQKGRHK